MARWEVQWTPSGGILADSWNVYKRTKGAPDWDVVTPTRGTSAILDFVSSPKVVEIGVAPVVKELEAPERDWTVIEIRPTATTDLGVPADVTSFTGGQAGAEVSFSWDDPDDPNIETFEIRQGTSWSNAIKVFGSRPGATSARFAWMASGSTTYYIKAKSKAGDWSASAASVTIVIAADEYMPIQTTTDDHTAGFTGAKSDVEVDGSGDLVPVALPASYADWTDTYTTYTHPWWWPYIPSGTYVTPLVDNGAVVNEKIEVALGLTGTSTSPTYDEWFGQVDPEFDDTQDTETAADSDAVSVYSRINSDGNTVDAFPITIEIDTAQDGVPTWDGYRIWVPGATYRFRQVRLRFTFGFLWPFFYPKVTGLVWRLRRQNRKDEKTVTVTVTGGTAVTWDTTFTTAPKVTVSVIGTSAIFATAENVTTSGCDVRTWNTSGTEQSAGTVHVHAMGV